LARAPKVQFLRSSVSLRMRRAGGHKDVSGQNFVGLGDQPQSGWLCEAKRAMRDETNRQDPCPRPLAFRPPPLACCRTHQKFSRRIPACLRPGAFLPVEKVLPDGLRLPAARDKTNPQSKRGYDSDGTKGMNGHGPSFGKSAAISPWASSVASFPATPIAA
jgi:hypothetical protein